MSTRPRRYITPRSKPKRTREEEEIALGQESIEVSKAARIAEESTGDTFEKSPVEDPFKAITEQTTTTGVLFGAPPTQSVELHDRRDPGAILSRPGAARVLDTEEVVRRELAKLAPDASQGQRAIADSNAVTNRFVLRGLSQMVPNPKYHELADRRRQFEDQRNYIVKQRQMYDRLFYNRYPVDAEFRAEFDKERDKQRLQFLQGFQPPQALALLKPTSEKIKLTEYWRRHLSDALVKLLNAYQEENTPDKPSGGTRHFVQELVNYHVRPIVRRRLAEIESAQFDDFPITKEVLQGYFNQYMTAAYNRFVTMDDEAQGDVGAVMRIDEQSGDATSLGRAFTTSFEEAPQLVYYASTLTLYASREYTTWLREWKKQVDTNVARLDPNDSNAQKAKKTSDDALAKLGQFVQNAIRISDRYQSASNTDYFHATRPLSIDDYCRDYRRLVFLEIAQHRADNLLSENEMRAELETYFVVPSVEFNIQLLYNLPLTFRDRLREAYEKARESIDANDQMSIDALEQRLARANQALEQVCPSAEPHSPHGPIDKPTAVSVALPQQRDNDDDDDDNPPQQQVVVDTWSEYDLSYPLDIDLTERAKRDISVESSVLAPVFDIAQTIDVANRRRESYGVLYANRRLAIELSQAEYLLKHVLSPTVEAPLSVERAVYDNSELTLEARLELSPLLASRVMYVPVDKGLPIDAEAQAALDDMATKRFTITWYHRPLHEGGEREVSRGTLDNTGAARLRIATGDNNNPSSAVLNIAGQYRAVVTDVDANKQYESVFVATIRVYAECVRDGKRFAPSFGRAHDIAHGQCVWRPTPQNADRAFALQALRVLVTRGVVEYDKYKRTYGTYNDAVAVERVEQTEAPWGSSAPDNLHRIAMLPDAEFHNLFTMHHIIERCVARVAALIRTSPDVDTVGSELQIVGQFVSNALYGESNTTSTPSTLQDDVPVSIIRPRTLDQPVILASNALAKLAGNVQRLTDARADQLTAQFDNFAASVRDASMFSLLQLLTTPLMSALQTGREQRFVNKLVGDYQVFVRLYTAHVAVRERVVLDANAPNYSEAAAKYMLRHLDSLIRLLTADEIHRLVLSEDLRIPDIFIDTNSRADLRALIDGLPSKPIVRTSSELSDELWKGCHSYVTDQPDMVVVTRSSQNVPPTLLPRKLAIKHRGSEPLSRGYDYDALFRDIEHSVVLYNDSATRGDPSQTLYDETARRVTIYNYFAFLAPPLSRGTFLSNDALQDKISGGVFANVAMFAPTPLETE